MILIAGFFLVCVAFDYHVLQGTRTASSDELYVLKVIFVTLAQGASYYATKHTEVVATHFKVQNYYSKAIHRLIYPAASLLGPLALVVDHIDHTGWALFLVAMIVWTDFLGYLERQIHAWRLEEHGSSLSAVFGGSATGLNFLKFPPNHRFHLLPSDFWSCILIAVSAVMVQEVIF